MIGDSGASNHFVGSTEGMFDIENIDSPISGVGNQTATKQGKMICEFQMQDGTTIKKRISVKYVPNLQHNLFSITEELSKGAILSSNFNLDIRLDYPNGSTLSFDRRLRTRDGWVPCVRFAPLKEIACLAKDDKSPCDINEYHAKLGHPNMVATRMTAKIRDVALKGDIKPCEDCMIAKARQKNVPKARIERSEIPGERIFIDISSPTKKSVGGSKHWLLVLDDCTDMPFSFFISEKDLLEVKLIPWIKELKIKHGIVVKIIRCDNAGENNSLQATCKAEGLGITFEYTAPGTPQQNGRVERKFQTLYGRVRAMIHGSGLEKSVGDSLWPEAANTATDLDAYLVHDQSNMSAADKFFGEGKECPIDGLPKKFGEECIISDRTKIKAKLRDRGRFGYWMGYAKDHAKDTFRIYNPKTRKIIFSRDIKKTEETKPSDNIPLEEDIVIEQESEPTLLEEVKNSGYDSDESYTGMPPLTRQVSSSSSSDDSDSDDENIPDASDSDNEIMSDEEDNDENEVIEEEDSETITTQATAQISSNKKVVRAMRNLESSFNPDAQKILEANQNNQEDSEDTSSDTNAEELETGRDDSVAGRDEAETDPNNELPNLIIDLANIATTNSADLVPKYVEPKTFNEAWFHPDEYQRKMWREAISKEYRDMSTRVVWKLIQRSMIPRDRRLVKCKWVFKIKRNGTFRARLVACGYSQIPGVDFSQSYSPVINDITFRMLLLAMIYFGLSGKIADVETAFLYGDLEEEIYMECPPGMTGITSDQVLLLLKCIYGLVQAARQYHKKFVTILKSIGYTGGDVDPCLFVRKTKQGICFVGIYVDDNLLIGNPKAIDETIAQLREKGLVLKVENDLHDYLSCEIVFSDDKKKAWLGQPYLISKLELLFNDEVKGLQKYKTPGTPSAHQVRELDKSLCLPAEKQTRFRSGVGMLLYLVKHSRPDIANCVRELSKVLDGATPGSYKEMCRVIKYVLDTKELGLKIVPDNLPKGTPWNITCFTDSDYATDPVTRRSVTGYIIYVHGVPVVWRSKAQQSITLSSTEAEWYALSEGVKEVRFLQQLCESMMIQVVKPVTVRIDNIAAISMSKNVTTTSRTRHVDVRTKYVREYVEDGVIKIIFVRTENNDSDILTKNLSSELHGKHSRKLIGEK